MDDALPDRLAVEYLFEVQGVDQRGRSAVLAFNRLFELARADFHARFS